MDLNEFSLICRYSEVVRSLDGIIREQLVTEGIRHTVHQPAYNHSQSPALMQNVENTVSCTVGSIPGSTTGCLGAQRDTGYISQKSTEANSKMATTNKQKYETSCAEATSSKGKRRAIPNEKTACQSRMVCRNKLPKRERHLSSEGSKFQRNSAIPQEKFFGEGPQLSTVGEEEKVSGVLKTRLVTAQSGFGISAKQEPSNKSKASKEVFIEHFKPTLCRLSHSTALSPELSTSSLAWSSASSSSTVCSLSNAESNQLTTKGNSPQPLLDDQQNTEMLPGNQKNFAQLQSHHTNAEQLSINRKSTDRVSRYRNSTKLRPIPIGCVAEGEMLQIINALVKAQDCFSQFPQEDELRLKQDKFLEKKRLESHVEETRGMETKENTRKILMEKVVQYFEQKIVETVRFAKRIPGFLELSRDDQANLIKESRNESDLISGMRGINSSNSVFTTVDGYHFSADDMLTVFPQESLNMFLEGARKVGKIDATLEEAAVLRAITLTFSDRCELQCREKVEDIQNRLVSCLLYVVKKRAVPFGIRIGQLFDFLVFCRNITDVELKTTKRVLIETEKYSSNPIINEVL